MDDLRKQFVELEEKANRILEHPESLLEPRSTKGFLRLLRLWHYPALHDPYRVWILYRKVKDRDSDHYKLLSVAWDRPADAQRLGPDPMKGLREGFHTEPTISYSQTSLPKSHVDKLINRIRRLAIPPFVKDDSVGLDGEDYGIEFTSFMASAKVTWWCRGPHQWKRLTRAVNELIELFETHQSNDR